MESPLVRLQLSSSSTWALKRRRVEFGQERSGIRRNGDDEDEYYQFPECPINDKKHFFYLFGAGNRLSYMSIPISSLFYLREGFLEQSESDDSGVYRAAIEMSCICLKNSVYLIGGRDRVGMANAQDCRDVMCFDIQSSKWMGSPESCKRTPMHSGKAYPLVLEHKGIIYVLSHSARIPGNYFESYDPRMDKWDILEPPPFYDESFIYYIEAPLYFSYVVLDNKICISVDAAAAFAFDLETKKWEPCHLFTYFKDPSFYPERGRTFYDDDRDSGGNVIGRPFYFFGDSIVVEEGNYKYLISTAFVKGVSAVAYAISGERVVNRQILLSLPELVDDHLFFHSLVALGEDYYCMMFLEERGGFRGLQLVTFWASPKKASESEEFFRAGSCNKCKIRVAEEEKANGSMPMPFAA